METLAKGSYFCVFCLLTEYRIKIQILLQVKQNTGVFLQTNQLETVIPFTGCGDKVSSTFFVIIQFIRNTADISCVCKSWRSILSRLKKMAVGQIKCNPELFASLQNQEWAESYVYEMRGALFNSIITPQKNQWILRVSGSRGLTSKQENEAKLDGTSFISYEKESQPRLLVDVEREIQFNTVRCWEYVFISQDWFKMEADLDSISGNIIFVTKPIRKFYNISKIFLQGEENEQNFIRSLQLFFPNCETLWVVAPEGKMSNGYTSGVLNPWKLWPKVKKLYLTCFYHIPKLSDLLRSFPELQELHLIRSTNTLIPGITDENAPELLSPLVDVRKPLDYPPTSVPYYATEEDKVKSFHFASYGNSGVSIFCDIASFEACHLQDLV